MVRVNLEHIHSLRGQLQLTQVQFAQLLGVSPNTVSRWERGVIAHAGDGARLAAVNIALIEQALAACPDSMRARFDATLRSILQRNITDAERVLLLVRLRAAVAGSS